MQSPAIDCQKLSKRYNGTDFFALKDLTLQVKPGEVYGFLGPNGAGKSTAIRTLMNFLQPTAGQATILGKNIVEDSVVIKREVGYLAGEVALYQKMTGQQFLDYMTSLQPLKHTDYLKQLVKLFKANLNKPIETLSKGNRQKIGIIQACMHEPAVLILDEPTSGLDPLMQVAFYEVIAQAKRRQAAVFLSSHDLGEVRKMCDRIGFIRDGQLVAEKTLADLQRSAAHRFDITFKGEAPLKALHALPAAKVTPITDHVVTVEVQGNLKLLLALLAQSDVIALDRHEVDLEEEFLSFYEEEPTS